MEKLSGLSDDQVKVLSDLGSMKALADFDIGARNNSAHPERDMLRLVAQVLHIEDEASKDNTDHKKRAMKRAKALLATLGCTTATELFNQLDSDPRHRVPTTESLVRLGCPSAVSSFAASEHCLFDYVSSGLNCTVLDSQMHALCVLCS